MSFPVVQLGDLCKIDRQGLSPDNSAVARLPYVGVENIEPHNGNISFANGSRVRNQKSTTFQFDKRHILYAKLRPYLNKVATPDFAGKCSTELIPLLPRDGVDREFIAYLLRTNQTVEYAMASVTGSRMPRTDMKVLMSLLVPLPPLAEQRRIVSILNRAVKIERLRAQAQGRLQEFIPALFVKMFGDPATNPMGWPSFKLCDLSKYRPQYGANARSITLVKGQPRYIRITDIQESGILSDKSVGVDLLSHSAYQLCEGDLLFARSGATVGKSYLYRPKDGLCVFAGYLIRFRLDTSKIHPEFAFRFTQTSAYARWLQNKQRIAAQPNVNAKEYGDLMIPTPPLAIQQRFATIARAAETISERITHNSKSSSALLSSLISRLLEEVA